MSTKRILYFAHPYGGDPANLLAAKRRLRQASEEFATAVIIAPWIPICEIYDDASPEDRRRHLDNDLRVVSMCDGIVLAGPVISSGMREELTRAEDDELLIYNRIGAYP